MPIAGIVAAVGLGLAAYGTVKQAQAQKKATRIANESSRQQQLAQDIQQSRERRAQIREARIRRAQAANTAEARSIGTSSTAAGTASNITSQAGANIGYLNIQQGIYANINELGRQRANALSDASTFGGIASLGMTVMSNSNDIANFFK